MTELSNPGAELTIGDGRSEPSPPSPWPTFVATGVASYIATLDMSIVNVAFAEIGRSFPGSSRTTISWVVTAYSILFGSLLVVSGRLADRVGRRRMVQYGSALFLAGSLACALSNGLGTLIAGRAVQGIGGALLMPAALGLLLGAFPRSDAVRSSRGTAPSERSAWRRVRRWGPSSSRPSAGAPRSGSTSPSASS